MTFKIAFKWPLTGINLPIVLGKQFFANPLGYCQKNGNLLKKYPFKGPLLKQSVTEEWITSKFPDEFPLNNKLIKKSHKKASWYLNV